MQPHMPGTEHVTLTAYPAPVSLVQAPGHRSRESGSTAVTPTSQSPLPGETHLESPGNFFHSRKLYRLSVRCPPEAQVFTHLVLSQRCYLGKQWKALGEGEWLLEVGCLAADLRGL